MASFLAFAQAESRAGNHRPGPPSSFPDKAQLVSSVPSSQAPSSGQSSCLSSDGSDKRSWRPTRGRLGPLPVSVFWAVIFDLGAGTGDRIRYLGKGCDPGQGTLISSAAWSRRLCSCVIERKPPCTSRALPSPVPPEVGWGSSRGGGVVRFLPGDLVGDQTSRVLHLTSESSFKPHTSPVRRMLSSLPFYG